MVDLAAWLAGRVPHAQWRRLASARVTVAPVPARGLRDLHLASKYLAKWRERVSTLQRASRRGGVADLSHTNKIHTLINVINVDIQWPLSQRLT